jgi:membrane protease YdiL (CAAX protease family)
METPASAAEMAPQRVAWGRVGLFYAIAFGMVCLLGAAFWLAGVDLTKGVPALVFQLTVAFLYMPMPFVAGLIVERMARRRLLLWDTFKEFRRTWWRVALYSGASALAIYLLDVGLVFLLGNALHVPGVGHFVATQQALVGNLQAVFAQALPPDAVTTMPPVGVLFALGAVSGVAAGFTINGLFAFGEEYGWRGVLMDELRPLGAWKANILTGVMWGLWHAPIILLGFNYGTQRLAGVVAMCVWLVPFSFLLWRAREYSGSVLAPAIIHGAFNGSAGFFVMLLASGNRVLTAPVGVLGAVTIAIVAAVAWALTNGRLFVPRSAADAAVDAAG